MKIRTLFKIQSNVEEKAIPSDILDDLEKVTYYSGTTKTEIPIFDMHLTHLVRAFAKLLQDPIPITYQVDEEDITLLNLIKKLVRRKPN